jgi:hypothetical protein
MTADGIVIPGFLDLQKLLTGENDSAPTNYLFDSIRDSVFLKGFRVPNVKNPALTSHGSWIVSLATRELESCRRGLALWP